MLSRQLLIEDSGSIPITDGAYIGLLSSTANLDSYTFSSASIGTAHTDRVVILVINSSHGGGSQSGVTSVTIGGVNAPRVAEYFSAFGSSGGTIAALKVSTGTTANIVVNFGETRQECVVGVFTARCTGSIVTEKALGISDGDAYISVVEGGAVFAGIINLTPTTYTWTGLTEAYDTTVDDHSFSGAYAVNLPEDSSYDIDTGQSQGRMVVVSLRGE